MFREALHWAVGAAARIAGWPFGEFYCPSCIPHSTDKSAGFCNKTCRGGIWPRAMQKQHFARLMWNSALFFALLSAAQNPVRVRAFRAVSDSHVANLLFHPPFPNRPLKRDITITEHHNPTVCVLFLIQKLGKNPNIFVFTHLSH